MDYRRIADQAKHHVLSFFKAHEDARFQYHNAEHTQEVVAASREIAGYYRVNDRDLFVVTVAAWFHDLGYLVEISGHEEKSAEMAEAFLKERDVEAATIMEIKKCIGATKIPQRPVSLLEQITCDADLFHLGTDEFSAKNKLLRKEKEAFQGAKIDKADWRNQTIQFLQNHTFHTEYARKLLNSKKKEHLQKLLEKQGEEPAPAITVPENPAPESKPEEKQVKKKNDRPERGIETMFRIGSGNNQRLSDMADTKAHIMISVNSIIISVLLSVLFRKIEEYPNLAFPAILLLTVSLVTIIFSILATRPNIPKGTFSQTDIDEKKVNLLFFGNYFRMSFDDYASGMSKVMEDRAFLYGTLIRDVYAQGVVLGRKYRLLKASYNVFMYGLIASVVAFIVASFFFQ